MSNDPEVLSPGLSSAEALQRLKKHGYNELGTAKSRNVWQIALEVIKEPMFLLLISCGILYILLGDYREGIILMSTIFLIILITFYQFSKTEKALEALKALSSPRVLVLRDGKEMRIAGREVVPGDVVLVQEGDRVGADGALIQSHNLTVDESVLTGESVPVLKVATEDPQRTSGKIYSGTLVTQGHGRFRVTATGMQTEFGKIGASLKSITQDSTRLQKEMKSLIRTLFVIGIVLCIGVVVSFYVVRGNFTHSLLTGLAAAMAILPEEFPVVLTVFLALGAWRLSRVNVLTRKPSAIETLGSTTVLCSDKTGTITQNTMEVVGVYNGHEALFKADFLKDKQSVPEIIRTAGWACHQDSADPMEKAIIAAHRKIDPQLTPYGSIIKEYPFSQQVLAMSIVYRVNEHSPLIICTKGAPEIIFELCRLNSSERAAHLAAVNDLAQRGYRVLGVCAASHADDVLPDQQRDFEFRFLGLLALEDPVRPEVPDAIAQCRKAGIKVIMITGDFPATAGSIGAQIGLDAQSKMLTGKEMNDLGDDELRRIISEVNIVARVIPEQKLRIVRALQQNGEVVAMTGDGVNDAPALKAADIGVSMGKKGTDVAREASSLVLLDDNFASLVTAIRSGRRIYDNLQKAMSYIMAIHIPIIGLTLLPAFFSSVPLLLMPLHIVFMELIIDPACSIAFEYEQEEKWLMDRKPRSADEKFFGPRRVIWSVLKGFLLLVMVLAVYYHSTSDGHTDGEARVISFSALIIGNVALILSSLSRTRSFLSIFRERNYSIAIIVVVAIGVLFATITIPSLQELFSFGFPGFAHFIPSLIGAGCLLAFLEIVKLYGRRRGEAGKEGGGEEKIG